MLNKLNVKTLLIIFGALTVVAVAAWVIDRQKGDRTFKKDLVQVDTAKVSSITVTPKDKSQKSLVIKKKTSGWEFETDGKTYAADRQAVNSMLSELAKLQPKRVAATSKDKWKEYEVTDSAAVRVVVNQGEETTADFLVGKFAYKQGPNMGQGGGNPYQQQQNWQLTTYVRLQGEEEVYAIDGFLNMTFNKNVESLRDKTLLELAEANVKSLKFTYGGDNSFTVDRTDKGWTLNGQPADSARTANFISSILNLSGSQFADNVMPSALGAPSYSLTVTGNNMQPIEVRGFAADSVQVRYIHSSQNPSAVFDGVSLYSRVFPSKTTFFASPTSK